MKNLILEALERYEPKTQNTDFTGLARIGAHYIVRHPQRKDRPSGRRRRD